MERPENYEQALEHLKSLKSRVYSDLSSYQRMVKFGNALREKYPDADDYQLFHFLIGSTPRMPCSKFDFLGEDSVERFLEEESRGGGSS